ncbi:MAG: hypothetical protein GY866_08300 [Proteobacteria bacterium]|nr:hypothetical protein [Pseudomonadota bacterium]
MPDAKSEKRRFQDDPDVVRAKASQRPSVKTGSASTKSKTVKRKKQSRSLSGSPIRELRPIDPKIPFSRSFIHITSGGSGTGSHDQGLIRSLRKNVKGIFETVGSKDLDRKEIVRLRQGVGNLKDIGNQGETSTDAKEAPDVEPSRPKTKKELLEERTKALGERSKNPRKSNSSVGIRIEIEKLKKKYPNEKILPIFSAVLTSKDGCSTLRSPKERINSLYAALQQAGEVVQNDFLTTYSVDTLFDVYFLYLDALNTKLMADLKAASQSDSESVRRDIRIMHILLEHKRLKKSIANIAQKLDGFGYPFESLSPAYVTQSYKATEAQNDERIGPGTVKLNKFLVRLYLSVFSQIPVFQPLAKKLSDALPNNRNCRALIASVNMENAITKFKISKANRALELNKMILTVFNYGKSFIGTNFTETVTSSLEAKILLRIAQMVEEYSLVSSTVESDMIMYAYNCASIALHYFKEEAEVLIKKISNIAARQHISLN